MKEDFEEFTRKDARLVILRALAEQPDGRMNETMITMTLETFGHRKSRDWVRTQMRALEELDAIRIIKASETFFIGELTRIGQDHVDRRTILEGVARPSPR